MLSAHVPAMHVCPVGQVSASVGASMPAVFTSLPVPRQRKCRLMSSVTISPTGTVVTTWRSTRTSPAASSPATMKVTGVLGSVAGAEKPSVAGRRLPPAPRLPKLLAYLMSPSTLTWMASVSMSLGSDMSVCMASTTSLTVWALQPARPAIAIAAAAVWEEDLIGDDLRERRRGGARCWCC